MTLTVPRAGSTAGRAAQISVPTSTTGSAIASFGNQMQQVGQKLERDYLDREAQQFQIDLTKDMNDLRLETSQIGDPDSARAHWEQGADQIYKNYEQPGENGRPRVSAKNRDRFNLAFQDLRNANGYSVGRQALAASQAQHEAQFMAYSAEATKQATDATPEQRSVLLAQGHDMIDQLVANGVIDAKEAERRRQALSGDFDNTRAIGAVARDPAGFLEALNAGEYDGLPADVREKYRVRAEGELASLAKESQVAKKREDKKRLKEVGDKLSDIRGVVDGGGSSVDEVWLASDEAKAHPDYLETVATVEMSSELPDLRRMTVEQLDDAIAEAKGQKVSKPWQTERAKIMEKVRDETVKGWSTDPVAHAEKVGFFIPELPDLEGVAPRDLARAIQNRTQVVGELAGNGYGDADVLFSKAEVAELKERTSIDNEPSERATLAAALVSGSGDADMVAELTGDPVLAHVGGMLNAGADPTIAHDILAGQQVLDKDNVQLPPIAQRVGPTFDALDQFFADQPGGEATQAAIVSATDALYATRKRRVDPEQHLDESVYRQSMHEVLGGTGSYNGRDARGGLQEFRGHLTPITVGISPRRIETVLTRLQGDATGYKRQRYSPRRELDNALELGAGVGAPLPGSAFDYIEGDEARAHAAKVWQSASVNGGFPSVNGEMIDGDTIGDVHLRAVGNDVYQLVDEDGRALEDSLKPGRAYEFRLSTLSRAYPGW